MEDGTYTAATAAFVKWLQTSGTSVSDKIDLVDMRDQGAGRGVGTMHRSTINNDSSETNPLPQSRVRI
jgi:hypothetical protein